jgi:tetratricopeptide (TPR) repeat protein
MQYRYIVNWLPFISLPQFFYAFVMYKLKMLYRAVRVKSTFKVITLGSYLMLLTACRSIPQVTNALSKEVEFIKADQYHEEGVRLLRNGDFKDAEQAFFLSIDTFPTTKAIDGIGCVMILQGRYSEAKMLYQRLVAEHSDYAQGMSNYAYLLENLGDNEGARKLYAQALSIDKENIAAINNSIVNQENFLVAQKEYDQSIQKEKRKSYSYSQQRQESLREDNIAQLRRAKVISPHSIVTNNLKILQR